MEHTIKLINEAVDKYKDSILETERYIWNNPETGFKEWKSFTRRVIFPDFTWT